MKASDNAYTLIKESEGLELKAYKCPAGIWTIGYGHTSKALPGYVISKEKAEQLLREDVGRIENFLNAQGLNINQGQFDALIDFVFNLGPGNFLSSTLLKKIKADPNDKSIAREFKRWVYSSGRMLPGLVVRRAAEVKLYFS